jgi:solute carrier family 25 carnitine/acylcarnitine transporter 20/29
MNDFINKYWDFSRKFVAGSVSGCCLVFVGHPFDTIKVRLQMNQQQVIPCITDTFNQYGITGFYKGMLSPLLLTGSVNSLLFGMQYNLVEYLNKHHTHSETMNTCKAAIVSGFLISFVVTPMECIKVKLQSELNMEHKKYNGMIDCIRNVYRKDGLSRGIYRGFQPTVLCRMSNYAYFGSYIYFTDMVKKQNMYHKYISPICIGGVSGIVYWMSCYPMDVIKNTMQGSRFKEHRNMVSIVQYIYTTKGIYGFTRGFLPCILRSFPANAAAFTGYEITIQML